MVNWIGDFAVSSTCILRSSTLELQSYLKNCILKRHRLRPAKSIFMALSRTLEYWLAALMAC
ncbi:hypothetical protein C7T35_39550 [Variovorax sp. WS11]|nr:hypothetical protein C7T35_39550 [Variovorax sp. WS11]